MLIIKDIVIDNIDIIEVFDLNIISMNKIKGVIIIKVLIGCFVVIRIIVRVEIYKKFFLFFWIYMIIGRYIIIESIIFERCDFWLSKKLILFILSGMNK